MKQPFITLLFVALFLPNLIQAQYFKPSDIDIPYKEYTLDNGLKLIVHEDHKAPIVAVNVWYHVGSKNEKPGKSGFAHLFEHLMFNGSENFNDDYFQALDRIGATDRNGTTNNDRTNYFQNVPKAALDKILFLESDRMGHLLGAIDQEKLDEQRGVVQNEKRQGENQPYGVQYDLLNKAMFPMGHPYSWTVIGEMEHLNAATLDDVHEWFKTYYGAANAVVSVAGDVDSEEIYKKVNDYFGNIAPGPTLIRPEVNIPVRTHNTRQSYEDRVPESRIVIAWNTAEWGNPEEVDLELVGNVLASGKNSRLYKKLVYEEQVASRASAFSWSKELVSNFIIQVNVKPGQDVAKVEAMTLEVLNDFLKNGPTPEEINRVQSMTYSSFIKGIERIGGFGGKSDILAQNAVFGGSPDHYKKYLNRVSSITPERMKATANKWLTQGSHTLICNPFPTYKTTGKEVDRSVVPDMGPPATASFPDLQETTLSNGLKVVLAKRSGVPSMVMNMMFDAGYASDKAEQAGLASIAMNMLDEGTSTRNSLKISEELELLGARLSSYSGLDNSVVSMSTLKPTFDPSLDMMIDVLMNPAFPEKEFDRLKQAQVSGIAREKSQPVQMALRVLPNILFDKDHAYAKPLTGSGTEATVESLELADVKKFYSDYITPNNAKLVVVGDIDMAELEAKLEKKFKNWKKGNEAPQKNLATAKAVAGKRLFIMDRPESEQSIIIASHLIKPYGEYPEMAKKTMMDIFGGQFTSRLNMNLREDKHWAYGAFTFVNDAKGQRPLVAYAPVQTDKTAESVSEIIKEFDLILNSKPITEAEFSKTVENNILKLPGRWETNRAVAGSVNEIVTYDLPKDHYQTFDANMRSMKVGEVQKMATEIFKPNDLNWVIVGDKSKILEGLKALDFDEIVMIDADGNVVEQVFPAKP